MTSILPCIAITGGIMQKLLAGHTKYALISRGKWTNVTPSILLTPSDLFHRTSLKHVAEGGSFAEE